MLTIPFRSVSSLLMQTFKIFYSAHVVKKTAKIALFFTFQLENSAIYNRVFPKCIVSTTLMNKDELTDLAWNDMHYLANINYILLKMSCVPTNNSSCSYLHNKAVLIFFWSCSFSLKPNGQTLNILYP